MAAKKKPSTRTKRSKPQGSTPQDGATGATRTRQRRSDDDKIRLVRQVLASGNQSAEIKKLGIYPNQFYDWKKKYAQQLDGVVAPSARKGGGRSLSLAASTVAEEAKAFISGKAALLDRLRAQRSEIDHLIGELEG